LIKAICIQLTFILFYGSQSGCLHTKKTPGGKQGQQLPAGKEMLTFFKKNRP
jgi:hypothetical protein